MANKTGKAAPQADKARKAAVEALVQMHRGGYANLVAKKALAVPALSTRDKAFAAALFYGTAERVLTLDWLLGPFLKKPADRLDVEVRAVLEAGLYQMLAMRVPASAAVNESVKLVRALGKSSAAGLVNAVLRRAGERYGAGQQVEAGVPGQPAWPLENAVFLNEVQRVCITYSVSEAVAKAVMAALPERYDAFLAASFAGGETCLRVNTLKTTAEALTQRFTKEGIHVRGGHLPNCLYAVLPGGVENDLLFREGFYHVQGEGSQYACACLAPEKGDRVLDVCAAPGGKSATLAQMAGGGETLTACDIHAGRLQLVAETLCRLGIAGATLLCRDARAYTPVLAGQRRVLCDVPCSGLGVLAAKADLRTATGENFAALPALQLEILHTAARCVQKGGRLVYSTCTVRKEENEQVVRAFLRESKQFRLVPPLAEPPPGSVIYEEMVTVLPDGNGLDGFFVATLENLW